MAGLTRCLVPSEVTWERKVILMPSPYYCYIVTSETGVWWVGVTPLGRSQAHGGVKAQTHTHKHTQTKIFSLRFMPAVHSHKHTVSLSPACVVCVSVCVCVCSNPSLTHRLKPPPQGA